MNTLQAIWSALTVPNEMLIKFLAIPLTFLDVYVCMLYFSTILNIKTTHNSQLIYVIVFGTIANIITFIVPTSYSIFVNIIIWPLMIFFILKTAFLKSVLAEVITLVTTSVLEFVISTISLRVFHIDYSSIMSTPLYRLIIALCIYLIIYLLYRLIKFYKVNIHYLFDNLSVKNKVLIILTIILTLFIIAVQFYLVRFYSNTMPFFITFAGIAGLVAYAIISIYNLINISKLTITQQNLESATLEINSLTILHDQVRSFKHDFDNIVNSIGGYVVNEDIEGLKRYYNQLLEECHKTNNLYALSPKVVNHPAIYHILATKYYEANQLDIQINLNVFLDLNEIEQRMKIYDFTRILGILLDNAIDASKECDEKILNVTFRKEIGNGMITVIIENTYTNKDVNTEDIYQKGNSSKENHQGLGLWKVRQILTHNNNLNLYTTKNEKFFTQQFEIYK